MTLKNVQIQYSIVQAVADGLIGTVNEYLRMGWNANSVDEHGKCGLHWAASRGRENEMRALLEAGAEVNVYDCYGNTPLHYCGHVETVQLLLAYGADPLLKNDNGDTAELLMKRRGVEEDALLLIQESTANPLLQNTDDHDESSVPLLHHYSSTRVTPALRAPLLSGFMDLWYDFCKDLGLKRLVILIIVLFFTSMYVAYFVTTVSSKTETKLPVGSDQYKVEL